MIFQKDLKLLKKKCKKSFIKILKKAKLDNNPQ